MNTLTSRIQNDFVNALKSKDENAKRALSFLKSKITELEKQGKGQPINDDDIYNVVNKLIKQRKESIDIYTKANRMDLVEKENAELKIISTYQPTQLEFNEIVNIIKIYHNNLKDSPLKGPALIGNVMGMFNKSYKGRADLNIVKQIIEDIFNG